MKLSLKSNGVDRAKTALARVVAWRWSKPLGRAFAIVVGLVALAWVGHGTFSGTAAAKITADATAPEPSADARGTPLESSPAMAVAVDTVATPTPTTTPTAPAETTPLRIDNGMGTGAADVAAREPTRHGPATPEDPVVLNTATPEDLQRLPGVGQKRAYAIVAIRTRLGKFRQIEDLLKVRGLGRRTLARLKPLVRIDPPVAVQPDGGADAAP